MGEQERRPLIPTCVFCMPFYFLAAFAICYELLPPNAFAMFGGGIAGNTLHITLGMAGVSLVIGGSLHAIFYWHDPTRFDVRSLRQGGIVIGLLCTCYLGLSYILSKATGLPASVLTEKFHNVLHWVATATMGLLILFLVLSLVVLLIWIAWLFVAIRSHPASRMARQLAARDYQRAVQIGEAIPEDKRDLATRINLAIAYARSGKRTEAEQFLKEYEQMDQLPDEFSQEVVEHAINNVRAALDSDSRSTKN